MHRAHEADLGSRTVRQHLVVHCRQAGRQAGAQQQARQAPNSRPGRAWQAGSRAGTGHGARGAAASRLSAPPPLQPTRQPAVPCSHGTARLRCPALQVPVGARSPAACRLRSALTAAQRAQRDGLILQIHLLGQHRGLLEEVRRQVHRPHVQLLGALQGLVQQLPALVAGLHRVAGALLQEQRGLQLVRLLPQGGGAAAPRRRLCLFQGAPAASGSCMRVSRAKVLCAGAACRTVLCVSPASSNARARWAGSSACALGLAVGVCR